MSGQEIISALAAIVGKDRVLTAPEELENYGRDWTKFYTPSPTAITLPASVEEVQAIVKLANELDFAIVPSGGRTGLSGGAVASKGEVVIAMDRLNKVLDFNPIDQTVTCQAGVITEQLQLYAEEQGLYYPVDFASSGSSQIGGNISTNAGGIKVINYGMTRQWVAGLKVVTGSGEILELNHGLQKNNTGYDLHQLFIGGEGTLGLVVEATMRLTRTPYDLNVMVLGVPAFDAIMDVLKAFRAKLDLTAFEFFSEAALQKVVAHQDIQRPFETPGEYYALVEFECLTPDTLDTAMAVFEHCVEQGWVLDGTISQSQQQANNLWRLREDISETLSQWTPYKNDLSVMVSKVPDFIAEIDAIVREQYPHWEVIWYGHIGDGNVHLNILKPDDLAMEDFVETCKGVSERIFKVVQRYRGSVSAEHGVGLVKKDYLGFTRSDAEIALMKQIKQAFDPKGVMNPGKIFD